MDNIKIGDFLKSLRKANGLTQEEVANTLMVSPKTISRWECGDGLPDINIISAVADLYNVTVDEILKGEKNNKDEGLKEESIALKNKNKDKLILKQIIRKYNIYFYVSLGLISLFNIICFILLFFEKTIDVSTYILIPGIVSSLVALLIGIKTTKEEVRDNLEIIDDKLKDKIKDKVIAKSIYIIDCYIVSFLIFILKNTLRPYFIAPNYNAFNLTFYLIVLLSYGIIRINFLKIKKKAQALKLSFSILSIIYVIYCCFFSIMGQLICTTDVEIADILRHGIRHLNFLILFNENLDKLPWTSYFIYTLGILIQLTAIILQIVFVIKKKNQLFWINILLATLGSIVITFFVLPVFITSRVEYNISLFFLPSFTLIFILIMSVWIIFYNKKQNEKEA